MSPDPRLRADNFAGGGAVQKDEKNHRGTEFAEIVRELQIDRSIR
jgi:hypothetical protein